MKISVRFIPDDMKGFSWYYRGSVTGEYKINPDGDWGGFKEIEKEYNVAKERERQQKEDAERYRREREAAELKKKLLEEEKQRKLQEAHERRLARIKYSYVSPSSRRRVLSLLRHLLSVCLFLELTIVVINKV